MGIKGFNAVTHVDVQVRYATSAQKHKHTLTGARTSWIQIKPQGTVRLTTYVTANLGAT